MAAPTLDAYRIPSVPASMFYLADFLSPSEEASILEKIPSNRWIALSHRRLQAVPARLTATDTLVSAAPLPLYLTDPIVARFAALGLFADAPHHAPNHCLINEYLPGQGIMPHEDGDAYHPVVATVSLGGTVVLDVSEKQRQAQQHHQSEQTHPGTWRIVQEPRSLLVTLGAAYTDTLHGIAADVTEDVDLGAASVANWRLLSSEAVERISAERGVSPRDATRISLTFRDVKRVAAIGPKLFGKVRG